MLVAGFQLAGAEGYRAETPQEAIPILRKLIEIGNHAIIILPERFAEATRELRRIRAERLTPIFVFVPDYTGIKGIRIEELKRSISVAVGAKLKF